MVHGTCAKSDWKTNTTASPHEFKNEHVNIMLRYIYLITHFIVVLTHNVVICKLIEKSTNAPFVALQRVYRAPNPFENATVDGVQNIKPRWIYV